MHNPPQCTVTTVVNEHFTGCRSRKILKTKLCADAFGTRPSTGGLFSELWIYVSWLWNKELLIFNYASILEHQRWNQCVIFLVAETINRLKLYTTLLHTQFINIMYSVIYNIPLTQVCQFSSPYSRYSTVHYTRRIWYVYVKVSYNDLVMRFGYFYFHLGHLLGSLYTKKADRIVETSSSDWGYSGIFPSCSCRKSKWVSYRLTWPRYLI